LEIIGIEGMVLVAEESSTSFVRSSLVDEERIRPGSLCHLSLKVLVRSKVEENQGYRLIQVHLVNSCHICSMKDF